MQGRYCYFNDMHGKHWVFEDVSFRRTWVAYTCGLVVPNCSLSWKSIGPLSSIVLICSREETCKRVVLGWAPIQKNSVLLRHFPFKMNLMEDFFRHKEFIQARKIVQRNNRWGDNQVERNLTSFFIDLGFKITPFLIS